MTRKEMVEVLSDRTGVARKEVEKVLGEMVLLTIEEAKKGDLRIAGLGTFRVRSRKGRTTKNPKTGEECIVPERNVLTFKAAGSSKDL